jgi:hypothetical protein
VTAIEKGAPARERPIPNHTTTADFNRPVRCTRCKRRLSAVVSVSLRIGPVCHRRQLTEAANRAPEPTEATPPLVDGNSYQNRVRAYIEGIAGRGPKCRARAAASDTRVAS